MRKRHTRREGDREVGMKREEGQIDIDGEEDREQGRIRVGGGGGSWEKALWQGVCATELSVRLSAERRIMAPHKDYPQK